MQDDSIIVQVKTQNITLKLLVNCEWTFYDWCEMNSRCLETSDSEWRRADRLTVLQKWNRHRNGVNVDMRDWFMFSEDFNCVLLFFVFVFCFIWCADVRGFSSMTIICRLLKVLWMIVLKVQHSRFQLQLHLTDPLSTFEVVMGLNKHSYLNVLNVFLSESIFNSVLLYKHWVKVTGFIQILWRILKLIWSS